MKLITLNEIKNIELDILKDVAKFCDLNNIQYYLAYGTLLGAIRHKGFIPWDDDIDIIMPRPDYIKFIENYPNNANKNYILTSIYNNDDHLYTFTKVYDSRTEKIEEGLSYNNNNVGGVEIDIFPMDGVPEDINESNKFFDKQKKWFKYYSFSISKFKKSRDPIRTIFKFIIFTITKVIGKERFIKIINKRAMKNKFEESKYVASSCVPYYGNKERICKSNYIGQIKIEFEGEFFNAPNGYDEYLSNIYGNYMRLPPIEQRITHHKYQVFWGD